MASQKHNKVRIIAGRFRGRNITFADSPGLRPTGDRLREMLFSWLQPYIVESRVLDLFAGSGALGFEAVSRGAAQVTMVEKSRKVCAVLRQNAAQLEADDITIICADALDLLSGTVKSNRDGAIGPADIVFVDPPFGERLHQTVIDELSRSQQVVQHSLVVIESDRRADQCTVPAAWLLLREKVAGEVRLQLFQIQ